MNVFFLDLFSEPDRMPKYTGNKGKIQGEKNDSKPSKNVEKYSI